MKKNSILFIIFILLIGIAAFAFFSQKSSTLNEEYTDFAIKDTAAVTKIKMTTLNNKATLSRTDTAWIINNKYKARQDGINMILKTLYQIQVLEPVSDFTLNGVIKELSSSATKVEFYGSDPDKPIKTWYIGGPTANSQGTFMLLEKDGKKSSRPMITYLPSNFGYLSTRFFLDENLWRNPIALGMNPKEIKIIKVESPTKLIDGYQLEHTKGDEFNYTNLSNGKANAISSEKVVPIFKLAKKLVYEYKDIKTDSLTLDSIFNSTPQYIITIENINGNKQKLKAFWMPVKKGAKDGSGKPLHYSNANMYALSSLNKNQALVIQNYLFDQIFKPQSLSDSTSVNK